MVSFGEALLIAAWIVLHGITADMQLLASFPVASLTYQSAAAAVVLNANRMASAAGSLAAYRWALVKVVDLTKELAFVGIRTHPADRVRRLRLPIIDTLFPFMTVPP
jgi:hypothetical protein